MKSSLNLLSLFVVCFSVLLGINFPVQAGFYSNQEPKMVLASNTFIFYPKLHKYVAIKNGKVIKSGRASGGRNYCPDTGRRCHTPVGTFHIQSMQGAGCKSSIYPVGRGGSKMPYCSFFSKYYAVHGSYEVPNYNASHGCIRIIPSDAQWLQRNFFSIGTTVIVEPY